MKGSKAAGRRKKITIKKKKRGKISLSSLRRLKWKRGALVTKRTPMAAKENVSMFEGGQPAKRLTIKRISGRIPKNMAKESGGR